MALKLDSVKFKAWDDSGLPLALGKVYTYETGTSIPKTTYTSETQSTPNSNPVILDARGEADIYINGTYKIVVTDENDVTIHTVDPITDPSNIGNEWVNSTSASYVSPIKFSVSGNLTSIFEVDRRVMVYDGAYEYATIIDAIYSGAITTVTLDSSVVGVGLSSVSTSIVGPESVGVGSMVKKLDSISSIEGLSVVSGARYSVTGYHSGSASGGGGLVAKTARHDGVTAFDPSRPFPTDITNQSQVDAWFADSGSDTLCLVRININDLHLENAGVVTGDTESYVAFNSAAFEKSKSLSSSTGLPVVTPSGKTIVINGFKVSDSNITIHSNTGERIYNHTAVSRTIIKIASGNLFGCIFEHSGKSCTMGGFTLDCSNVKYGIVDTAIDVYLHDMVIQYGQYGHIQAANGNSGLHERLTYIDNSKCNCAVIAPSTWSWTLPDLVASGDLVFNPAIHDRTTTVERLDVKNRLGGFGWVFSEGEKIKIKGTTESNKFASVVVLNQVATIGQLGGVELDIWDENGWAGFDSSTSNPNDPQWDVSGVELIHQSPGVLWSEWTPATHVGYSVVIGSVNSTHLGSVKFTGLMETQLHKAIKASKCDAIILDGITVRGFGGQGTGFDVAQDVPVYVRNSGGINGLTTSNLDQYSKLGFATEGGTAENSGGVFAANGLAVTVNPGVLKDFSAYPNYQYVINAFKHYVEFTPALRDGGGVAATATNEIGRITRVGDCATFFIQLNITSVSGLSGRISITGIPTMYGESASYGSANHGRFPHVNIANNNISLNVQPNNSITATQGAGLDAADVTMADMTTGILTITGTIFYPLPSP